MKTTHLIHQRLTKQDQFRAMRLDSLSSNFAMGGGECLTHSDHNLTLPLLAYKERQNEFTQMRHAFTTRSPYIGLLARIFGMLSSSSLRHQASEDSVKPVDQFLIGVSNLDVSLVIRDQGPWIAAKVSDINRAFSIDNSSEISNLRDRILFALIFISIHVLSPILNCTGTHYNIMVGQPQRLSPLALSDKRFDSLYSQETVRGRSEEVSPLYSNNIII
jgi:hypothetical protein